MCKGRGRAGAKEGVKEGQEGGGGADTDKGKGGLE